MLKFNSLINPFPGGGLLAMTSRVLCDLYTKTPDPPPDPPADPPADPPVTFTQEQLNKIVADRLKRDRDSRGELGAADKDALDVFRAAETKQQEDADAKALKEAEDKAEYERILETTKAQHAKKTAEDADKIARMRTANEAEHKKSAIQTAILPHAATLTPNAAGLIALGFQHGTPLKPDDPLTYSIKTETDEDEVVTSYLVDSEGNRPLDANAEHLTLTDAVALYLKNNQNLVTSNIPGGAGSSGNSTGEGYTKDKLAALHKAGQKSGKSSDHMAFMKVRRELKEAEAK